MQTFTENNLIIYLQLMMDNSLVSSLEEYRDEGIFSGVELLMNSMKWNLGMRKAEIMKKITKKVSKLSIAPLETSYV